MPLSLFKVFWQFAGGKIHIITNQLCQDDEGTMAVAKSKYKSLKISNCRFRGCWSEQQNLSTKVSLLLGQCGGVKLQLKIPQDLPLQPPKIRGSWWLTTKSHKMRSPSHCGGVELQQCTSSREHWPEQPSQHLIWFNLVSFNLMTISRFPILINDTLLSLLLLHCGILLCISRSEHRSSRQNIWLNFF